MYLKLNSTQMAEFTARGFLRLDGVIPEALNQQFLKEIGHVDLEEVEHPMAHYAKVMSSSAIPVVKPGTLLADAYPAESAVSELMSLPVVSGAI